MNKPAILLYLLIASVSASPQIVFSRFADPTSEYSTTSGGLPCGGCSITNPSYVADLDASNSATIVMDGGLITSRGIRAKLPSLVPGNTKAGFYISIGAVVSALPSVTLTTYKNGSLRQTLLAGGNIVTLLGGGLGYICATAGSGLDYDEVGISFSSGVLTVALTANVFYAFGGGPTCPTEALPVRNISLSASCKNYPELTWEVDDDGNVSYEVQRSIDGNLFKTIADETSEDKTGLKKFRYSDLDAPQGNIYYRILAVEKNSMAKFYSKTVSINFHSPLLNEIRIFPNPIRGNEFTIKTGGATPDQLRLQIIDKTGKLLYNEYVKFPDMNTSIIRLKSPLAGGVYIIRLANDKQNTPDQYGKLMVVN